MSKVMPPPASTPPATPEPSISSSVATSDAVAQAGDSALDWFATILDFIASISWPLLIAIVLASLLNTKIQKMLSSGMTKLSKTFKSFKVGGIEATLNDDEIQEQLEDSKDGLDESMREFREDLPPSSGPTFFIRKVEDQIIREPAKDPRIVALESYNLLESFIAKTVEVLNGAGEDSLSHSRNIKYAPATKPKTMSKLLTELSEHEVISVEEIATVNTLRNIRNEIAHDVASVEMSADTGRSYRKQCKQVIKAIDSRLAAKFSGPEREPNGAPQA